MSSGGIFGLTQKETHAEFSQFDKLSEGRNNFSQKISGAHSIIQQIENIYILIPYSPKCTVLSAQEVQDLMEDMQTAFNESVICNVGK